jgi:short-subunit dehydrogenase
MEHEPFRGQVVIVTGASAGIGKALALQLAAQGAKVALAARRLDRLEQVAAECQTLGGETLTIPTDVSDEGQCKALIEKTVSTFGRVDMLVNNAGLAVTSPLEKLPDLHLFKHVMDVNFYGALYCTYYAIPHLKLTQGRVVVLSSLGGVLPLPYNTSYTASKYALHGLYDSLRMELAQHGVSVTVICPSLVVSEFHEAQLDRRGNPRGPRGRNIYTDKMMTAEQCAAIVLKAARRRDREVLMGPGRLAIWLKLFAPKYLERFIVKSFIEPAFKRTRGG